MDELKVKVTSKFMKVAISKAIAKAVHKKFGFKPEIEINNLSIETVDGKIHFNVDAGGSIDEKALMKITRIIDDD